MGVILGQLEFPLAQMEEDASQPEAAAHLAVNAAASANTKVVGFQRRKPARRPLLEHLPRERIIYPPLSACPCCGGSAQAGQTRHRDVGGDSPAMEGDPACPREVLMPIPRGNYPTASASAPDCAWARRPRLARTSCS